MTHLASAVPIEDGDGADDGEEVEDALEGLRERRVERDEVEGAAVAVRVAILASLVGDKIIG